MKILFTSCCSDFARMELKNNKKKHSQCFSQINYLSNGKIILKIGPVVRWIKSKCFLFISIFVCCVVQAATCATSCTSGWSARWKRCGGCAGTRRRAARPASCCARTRTRRRCPTAPRCISSSPERRPTSRPRCSAQCGAASGSKVTSTCQHHRQQQLFVHCCCWHGLSQVFYRIQFNIYFFQNDSACILLIQCFTPWQLFGFWQSLCEIYFRWAIYINNINNANWIKIHAYWIHSNLH